MLRGQMGGPRTLWRCSSGPLIQKRLRTAASAELLSASHHRRTGERGTVVDKHLKAMATDFHKSVI